MAVTFTQAQVDSAVTYLTTGGPGGGELTTQQYFDMTYRGRKPQISGSILSDFAWQLQLAINQGHAGLGGSRNLCRDQYGSPRDVFLFNPNSNGGVGQNELVRFSVSISG
jgi:hypothetical protein